VTVRFTEKEYEVIDARFKKTTSNDLSHYIRSIVLNRPVTVKYRNQSLDESMEALISLKQELNAIGNNFNQAVRKLHSLKQIPEFREWLHKNESLQEQLKLKTDQVANSVVAIGRKWLQQ